MSVNLARLGWAGIAIEPTPGVPTNPTDYVPYTANTLQGKHTPIQDVSVRGIRNKNFSSVIGKKWGEGEITSNLDPYYSGYYFKLACGTEGTTTPGAGVTDHTFTVNQQTVPTTASIIFNKVAYSELFTYATVDQLELDVKDSLATIKATFKSQFPATSTSGTLTTTSGIVFTFKDMTAQFGATLASAQSATPLKLTAFNVKVKNNVEPIFRTGSATADSFAYKDLEVDGDYGIFLENQTEVNNYYNLTKQYAIFTFTGRGIGAGLNESVTITLYQNMVKDQPLTTGIDNLFAIKSSFVAEYSVADTKTCQFVVRNTKASVY